MRPAAGFAVAFETIFEKYRIYKTGRAAQTSYRQERENETVSYTHLDVYKRQSLDRDCLNRSGNEAWEAICLFQGLHQASWCRFRLQAGSATVSVTSLLEATGFLRKIFSTNSILFFFFP